MSILGLSKPTEVAKLSEDAAAELGAEMLGEIIMFTFGAAILVLEYRRQSRKEAAKEEGLQKKIDELTNQINELFTMVEIENARVREITRVVGTIYPDADPCEES